MSKQPKCADCGKRKAVVGLNGVWRCIKCFEAQLLEIKARLEFLLELTNSDVKAK